MDILKLLFASMCFNPWNLNAEAASSDAGILSEPCANGTGFDFFFFLFLSVSLMLHEYMWLLTIATIVLSDEDFIVLYTI